MLQQFPNSLPERRRFCRALGLTLCLTIGARDAIGQPYGMPMTPGGPIPPIQTAQGPRGATRLLSSANGTQVTMPVTLPSAKAAFARQSGLQLTVDASWPGQIGYRPIGITVRLAKPAIADMEIGVHFHAGDWYWQGKSMTVNERFTLSQGAMSASVEVILPQYQSWQLCGWEISVDGQIDDELTVTLIDFGTLGSNASSGMAVAGTMLSNRQLGAAEMALQTTFSSSNVALRLVDAASLPTDWLQYTALDCFLIPADQWPQFVDEHPPQAEALLRWVRSGGNLWLIEAGSKWQKLAAVDHALAAVGKDDAERSSGDNDDTSPDNEDESEGDEAILARGWRFAPLGERATEPGEGSLVLSGFEVDDTPLPKAPVTGDAMGIVPSSPSPSLPPDSRKWFAVRGVGLGVVTAFPADLQGGFMPSGEQTLSVISQSLLAPRLFWANRHGNQLEEENIEFNNLLIPNVGVAPVGQFQFLITLFVLAIGPLNYWLLKRQNKLPLLLATVPAAAVLTTVLLFSYGLLADGFGVRVRGRSVTLLDQRAGEAVSWGRFSYYAGIAPRDGLVVPRDQAMYPIMPSWRTSFGFGGQAHRQQREVTWNDQQRLTKGWLASRTPTQYHAIASRPSSKRLELRTTGEGLRVVNRLGSDVTHLGVQDHDGKFYWCENLAQDDGQVVPPTDQAEVATQMRRLFTANLPESPGGDDGRFGRGYYGFVLSQSVMEGRLEAINSPVVQSWGAGRYIAFTKEAIELELGIDEVIDEASFHVIEGSW